MLSGKYDSRGVYYKKNYFDEVFYRRDGADRPVSPLEHKVARRRWLIRLSLIRCDDGAHGKILASPLRRETASVRGGYKFLPCG